MRPFRHSLLLAVVLAILAAPAWAASPNKPVVIDLDDPAIDAEESAFWTDVCGFDVMAEVSGHIIVHNPKRGAIHELTVFHIDERLTSDFGTYHLIDVGPDIVYSRGGVVYIAVVGRSLTGSGVIGHVVVNTETGDVEWHGKLFGDEVFGDYTQPICRRIAPPAA
jgi:hypothetical protein